MSVTESALAGAIGTLLVVLVVTSIFKAPDVDLLSQEDYAAVLAGTDRGTVWADQTEANLSYGDGVDEALEQTLARKVVFSEVDVLPYDEDERVAVVIAPPEMVDFVSRELQGLPGPVGTDDAEVTRRVRAELHATSSDVSITPLGAMEQSIYPDSPTRFAWRVRAKTNEPFYLLFRLYNVARVGSVDHDREARAWGRKVRVEVSGWQSFTRWMDEASPIVVIFSILGGIFMTVTSVYGAAAWLRKRREGNAS